MNIRKTFEQAMMALMYGTTLVILGGGTLLMCLVNTGPIA